MEVKGEISKRGDKHGAKEMKRSKSTEKKEGKTERITEEDGKRK